MKIRTADSKGRIALGKRFANRSVNVQDIDATEVRITLVHVSSKRETWLYENPAALASVRRGISQARQGKTTQGPDMEAAGKLV